VFPEHDLIHWLPFPRNDSTIGKYCAADDLGDRERLAADWNDDILIFTPCFGKHLQTHVDTMKVLGVVSNVRPVEDDRRRARLLGNTRHRLFFRGNLRPVGCLGRQHRVPKSCPKEKKEFAIL
jgi:hypothetical protein